VAALSWTVRELQHQRIPVPERATWITSDKDSLYHMRRVERMFDEGLPGDDPFLSYPDGSAIPWPPYYTVVAWAWTAPGAPADPAARRDWIERRVASLPRAFGVATSLLCALAAHALAGPGAALFAGASHALSVASVVTGRVGNGDHHAFVACLAAAILLLTSRALRTEALADPRGSLRRGAAAGALAGASLGAWVASLLHLIPIQLALGWLVVRHARRPIPGLPAFGLGFHAAALLVLMPAALASPWKAAHPWMVVNLAWFQPVWLLAGGLVFVPLLRLRPGSGLRGYPGTVAAVLGGIAAVLFLADAGPATGIREGFAWMRRDDAFMGAVWESRGLLGEGAAFDPKEVAGLEFLALPVAWAALAWVAFRRSRHELLPWVLTVPPLFLQAARQVRFADALAMPMAVTTAWALAAAWTSRPLQGLRRRLRGRTILRDALLSAALLLFAGIDHAGSVRRTRRALDRDPRAPGQPELPADGVARGLAGWIRARTPEPPDYSVLASWTWGHLIEWVAGRPTVATNFGTFVGEEAFRDPARFLLTEEPAVAEAILERRRARYVMLTSWMPNQLPHLIRAADPTLRDRYAEPGGEDLRLRVEWYRTIGARLLLEGRALGADGSWGESLDFARVVHASAARDRRLAMRPGGLPAGWVWERVKGATVEARGAPGDTLEIAVTVRYAPASHEIEWSRGSVAAADGAARVRVPYATDAPNGDGVATGPARWRFAGRQGEAAIPEAAVMRGETIPLP
jgi:hypothetical protein